VFPRRWLSTNPLDKGCVSVSPFSLWLKCLSLLAGRLNRVFKAEVRSFPVASIRSRTEGQSRSAYTSVSYRAMSSKIRKDCSCLLQVDRSKPVSSGTLWKPNVENEPLVEAIRGSPAPISTANRNDELMIDMDASRTDRRWLERN
jgi:hypothetical protein